MRSVVATVVTLALLALGAGLAAQSGNDLFQQALVKERTEGNPTAAIALYQTIVQKHGSDRALVARALVQMGGCYEKLGSGHPIKMYDRVVREFGDQKESVATARARLAALRSLAAAPLGPTDRQLLAGDRGVLSESSVSPDGRYLGYFNGADPLAVHDLIAGTVIKRPGSILGLVGDENGYGMHIAFSPDGRQLAYTWYSDERRYELRVLTLTGGTGTQPRVVHRFDDEDVDYPWMQGNGWTPDGNLLMTLTAADGTWRIVSISMVDGSLRLLKSLGWRGTSAFNLSPDGRYVAYAMAQRDPTSRGTSRDIFLLATDGSRETVLEHRADDHGPVYSADGSQLVFVSDRGGTSYSFWTVPVE